MAELCLPGDNQAMASKRQTSKLRRFVRLDGADKWLLMQAVGWLAVARIRLAVTPFNRLAAILASESDRKAGVVDPELAARIGFAVRAAASNVPWRSDCFPQAIAARKLLARHGYTSTIHLGVEKPEENGLAGHAWLTSGEIVITGGERLDRYSEVHRL